MLRINLLPEERPKGRGRGLSLGLPSLPEGGPGDLTSDPWMTALVAAAVVTILAVGGSWLLQRDRARDLGDRIAALTEDSARLTARRAVLDSLAAERDQVRERFELVRRLDAHRYAWPRLMYALSAALPEAAWISGIQRESPLPNLAVTVRGVAASPLAITTYLRDLEASPYVESVRLQGSQRMRSAPGRGQSFTLSVRYGAARPGPDASGRSSPADTRAGGD